MREKLGMERAALDPYGLRQELRDLLRGSAGGLMFGTPVLYTMEVWFHGVQFQSWQLFMLLVFILVINISFCHFAGLRSHHKKRNLLLAMDDGITSLAIGIILAAGILLLIGRLDFSGEDWQGSIGQILIEACVMSVGITFTNYKFQSSSLKRTDLDQVSLSLSSSERQLKADLNDIVATVAGAVVFATNIAPTEEITLIASSLSSVQLGALLGAEILCCYLILYASGIDDQTIYEADSLFQKPWAETTMCVAFSLMVSGALLFLVGDSGALSSPHVFISTLITLGMPAVIGGAAGRLII
jgi:putative integral membrane protein (TIGR02587 family)